MGKENQNQSNSQGDSSQVNGLQTEELTQLREEVEELRKQHTLLQAQLQDKDALINNLRSETAEGSAGGSDNTELLKELEALRSQVKSQSAEINQMTTERQELLRRAEAGSADAVSSSSGGSLDAAKMAEVESRLAAQTTETERLKEEAKSLSESRAELEQQLATATSTVAILQTEQAKLQTEVQESKKEQDDLLMLLADQDQKILSLKQKLKDLGETVDNQLTMKTTSTPGTRQTMISRRMKTRTRVKTLKGKNKEGWEYWSTHTGKKKNFAEKHLRN
ncbi:hypothetical protein FQN60_011833 [Etheostoma spectabile]|uniref:Uso1/p115-like vesicle tethering protein C-terminal domain-containing protein n=1 Tax=Etheostoma spectabile TaxID=54343 RepID=A0A5J5DNE0_9PERO|nr:hypothetical protein FQN60_011833 [Etheostoma spectabile]